MMIFVQLWMRFDLSVKALSDCHIDINFVYKLLFSCLYSVPHYHQFWFFWQTSSKIPTWDCPETYQSDPKKSFPWIPISLLPEQITPYYLVRLIQPFFQLWFPCWSFNMNSCSLNNSWTVIVSMIPLSKIQNTYYLTNWLQCLYEILNYRL